MNDQNCEILAGLLRRANTPRTKAELCTASGLDSEALETALAALLRDGRAALTKKGKYAAPEKLSLIPGRARFQHSGAAILCPLDGGEALRIEAGRIAPMPDDLLLVRKTGVQSCAIEAVCNRSMRALAAFVRIERDRRARRNASFERVRATAIPCDPRIPYDILLDGDLSFVRNNEIALVEIDGYPVHGSMSLLGHVERVLGNADSMLARMRAAAEDGGFPTEFPPDVEEEAVALSRAPLPAPDESRLDLRACTLLTIDGANSKDFDDAVSIEALPEGGWRLGVHIADVSHYVRPGSAIDREALRRGTSLYLPGCTVPMLPEALSNGLCSLLPDADRLAMSLTMDVSAAGKVIDHRLTRSIIRSSARLTYAGVNRFFEGAEEIANQSVHAALLEMRALAQLLRRRRRERGSVDFDLPEAEFVLDARGEPEEILVPERGEAERMIEDFMLLANETVARLARDTLTPFLYRVHEQPDPERIHQLEGVLNLSGAPVRLGDHPHPGMLQRVLETNAESDAIDLIRRSMLRSLKRARYCAQPLGHYALSLEDYCHFTSPIRRYPDLTIHRMLKCLLDGRNCAVWERRMPSLAEICSQREQASVQAERAADDIMKAAWMSRQTGRKFWGIISGVTAWGLYVALPNTVEGLVHISDMDDYYVYDAQRQTLEGTGGGKRYRTGMRVRVRALRADVDRGEVNFGLVEDGCGRRLDFSTRQPYNID